MRHAIRWSVGLITIAHGLVHLLGLVDGLGWADVETLREPIGPAMAGVWGGTALLVVVAGVAILRRRPGWWPVAAVAAAVSQGVILTAWSDAWAGTIPNVLLAFAAAYGYRSHGASSPWERYRRMCAEILADGAPHGDASAANPVTEADLERLPAAVARWIRLSGAVGMPHVGGFRAHIRGRIRSGPDAPWMPFTGEQLNTYGHEPARLFLIDATMRGLPVDVLHVYRDGQATMQAMIASTVTIVDAAGPELDVAETVTLLNDMCLLSPATLVDAPVRWTELDDDRVLAEYTNAGHTVTAELRFDGRGRLVDFVSDDRRRAADDGTFTRERWSTPVEQITGDAGRTLVTAGRGRWHPEAGAFDYLEIEVDDIEYFVSTPATTRART